MSESLPKSFLLAATLLLFTPSAFAQKSSVDPKVARDCGCTLRNWPLLSDFVSKTMPSLASMQPDLFLPHYADAGCRESPKPNIQGIYGEVRFSKVESLDLFIDHDWHDFNTFVKLIGDASSLNSSANQKNNNSFLCYNDTDKSCPSIRGETLLEMEWDMKHYPEKFWASAGDSVWTMGRYVWDCGHPPDYHTEIHPPSAIALTRLEPYVFAGDASPSFTNTTVVYIHGRSGLKNYNYKTVDGVESIVFNGYRDVPVANQAYQFDIPLPAKPPGFTGAPVAKVVELPFGGPSPVLQIDSSQRVVHVKYPLNLGDASPDRKFGAVIVSGWRAPIASVNFRTLEVKVEQLQILKAHNAISASDWHLWLNVNGQWTQLEGLQTESKAPLGIDRLLDLEGLLGKQREPANINKTLTVVVPETDDARLTIQVAGWVNFYDALFGVREDLIGTAIKTPGGIPQLFSRFSTSDGRVGIFFKQFSLRENFGIGNHNFPRANYRGELSRGHEGIEGKKYSYSETEGDFAMAYTISEITKD
jgi:hypothetical protein